jgi:hypothetical protein
MSCCKCEKKVKYKAHEAVTVTGLSKLPTTLDALNVPVITYTTTVQGIDPTGIYVTLSPSSSNSYAIPNQPTSFATSTIDDFYSSDGDFAAILADGEVIPIVAGSYIGATMTLTLASVPANPININDVFSVQMNTTWYQNVSLETWIGVNPKNPKNIVIDCKQDRFFEFDLATQNLYSKDGGKSWAQSNYVMSRLQGATNFRAPDNCSSSSNAKVCFGPDGTLYTASTVFNLLPYFVDGVEIQDFTEANIFSKSTDGGETWSKLYLLEQDDGNAHFIDQPVITTDPYDEKNVYVVSGDDLTFYGGNTYIWIQTSRDKGTNWSAPFRYILAADPNENSGSDGPNGLSPGITVTPKAIIVTGLSFSYSLPAPPTLTQTTTLYVSRSSDKGKTWGATSVIAGPYSLFFSNPKNPYSNIYYPDLLTIQTMTSKDEFIYIVFPATYNNAASMLIMYSKDSGKNWSNPKPVSPHGQQTFLGSVAIAENGTVACLFYDFRNATNDPNVLATDVYVSLFDSSLHYLEEKRLTKKSFNLYNSVQRNVGITDSLGFPSYYLGDYSSITSNGNDFYTAYTVTNSYYEVPLNLVPDDFTGSPQILPVPPSVAPGNGFLYDPIPRNKVVFQKISLKL